MECVINGTTVFLLFIGIFMLLLMLKPTKLKSNNKPKTKEKCHICNDTGYRVEYDGTFSCSCPEGTKWWNARYGNNNNNNNNNNNIN